MRGERDTLPGLPLAELEAEPPPQLRDLLREQFAPVLQAWDARAGDMLAVLADSTAARIEIKAAVRTIRACAWCGVLALLLVGFSVWTVLEHDRAELRRLRELDQRERQAIMEELGRRINRACLR